jgi:CheY-like chemotaxis protein
MNGGTQDTVLVVEHDPVARHVLTGSLEGAGFDVIECPGPSAPDYTCVAARGEPCALARAADAIVLDLHQASDIMMCGLAGWQLFLYYYERGHRIVVLLGGDDPVRPLPESRVAVVRRPATGHKVVTAVRELLGVQASVS